MRMGPVGLKNSPQSIGCSREGLTTKSHLLALDDRRAWSFSLPIGHRHDVPGGGGGGSSIIPEERSEAPEDLNGLRL